MKGAVRDKDIILDITFLPRKAESLGVVTRFQETEQHEKTARRRMAEDGTRRARVMEENRGWEGEEEEGGEGAGRAASREEWEHKEGTHQEGVRLEILSRRRLKKKTLVYFFVVRSLPVTFRRAV